MSTTFDRPSVVSPNLDLIALLERHLADAKAGRIQAVGIISITSGGIINTASCNDVAGINLGCDQLKHQLREVAFPPAMQHLAPSAGRLSS